MEKKIIVTVKETESGNKLYELSSDEGLSGADFIAAGELCFDEADNM